MQDGVGQPRDLLLGGHHFYFKHGPDFQGREAEKDDGVSNVGSQWLSTWTPRIRSLSVEGADEASKVPMTQRCSPGPDQRCWCQCALSGDGPGNPVLLYRG